MAGPIPDKLVPDVANIVDSTNGTVYSFPFNINSLMFSYQMNNQSFSTIGGRVTQLLSVRLNTLSLQGEAGGLSLNKSKAVSGRQALIQLYENFKTLQDHQNTKKTPMTLNVPSRGLTFKVFLHQMTMAWDISTVNYPYQMSFEVDQELSGNSTINKTLVTNALQQLSEGVGYNTGYLGLTTVNTNVAYADLVSAIANGIGTGGLSAT